MSGKKIVLVVFLAAFLTVFGLILAAMYLRKHPPRRKLVLHPAARAVFGATYPQCIWLSPHRP